METAVLGLGRMGRALASRLVATGHGVTVWNRTPGRAGGLLDAGASEAASPQEAASRAEVVMSMLTDDDAVAEVLLPGGRPLPLPAGAAVLDASTVAPITSARLVSAYGASYAASPVLGSPEALAAGEAALVVAGPAALLDRLDPVLRAISGKVRRAGTDPQRALVMKLINNYMLMAGLAVLSEAVVTAQRSGIDDDALTGALKGSPMLAAGLANRLEDVIAGDHEGWFPTPMGAKDVRLTIEMAARAGVTLPVAEVVRGRYEQAATSGLGEADIAGVVELLRRA